MPGPVRPKAAFSAAIAASIRKRRANQELSERGRARILRRGDVDRWPEILAQILVLRVGDEAHDVVALLGPVRSGFAPEPAADGIAASGKRLRERLVHDDGRRQSRNIHRVVERASGDQGHADRVKVRAADIHEEGEGPRLARALEPDVVVRGAAAERHDARFSRRHDPGVDVSSLISMRLNSARRTTGIFAPLMST